MEELLLNSLQVRAETEIDLNRKVLQKIRNDEHKRDSKQAYLNGKVIK